MVCWRPFGEDPWVFKKKKKNGSNRFPSKPTGKINNNTILKQMEAGTYRGIIIPGFLRQCRTKSNRAPLVVVQRAVFLFSGHGECAGADINRPLQMSIEEGTRGTARGVPAVDGRKHLTNKKELGSLQKNYPPTN